MSYAEQGPAGGLVTWDFGAADHRAQVSARPEQGAA